MSYSSLIRHSINIQNVFKKYLLSYVSYSFLISIIFLNSIYINKIFIFITFFLFHFLIITFFSQKIVNGITFNQCLNNIESIKKL